MMKKRRYETNQSVVRRDGQLAFSPQSRAMSDQRVTAEKGGRIKRLLGTDGTFTDEFKSAFDPETEHLWILERVHLIDELDAAKKVRKALLKYPNDMEAQAILKELNAKPTDRKKDCILCPIWRHERELRLTESALTRYVFPRVRDELYLVTIVFDFAESLSQLEECLKTAQRHLNHAVASMGRKRRGVVMAGSFEPDLKTQQELTTERKSVALMKELGRIVPDAGGWTLTGHFFVRVPHQDDLEHILKRTFPAKGWVRVQFKRIKDNKGLSGHLMKILGYGAKMPKPLFDQPSHETRDGRRRKANVLMSNMSAAFYGPLVSPSRSTDSFDLNTAIVQWAKFMSRMGPKMIYYSVESAHAQKWYSASEMDYIRMTDGDMFRDGHHRIEIHRDHGPFQNKRVLDHLKGRVRILRSRQLTHDTEWETMTNCEGINPDTHYHDFDRWTLKPTG